MCVGVVAVLSCASLIRLVTGFTMSSLSGLMLHVTAVALPRVEVVVAVSVMLAGLVIIKQVSGRLVVGIFIAVAGLFHGFAYGEAIYGAPEGAIATYSMGIGFIQCGIAILVFKLTQLVLSGSRLRAKHLRLSAGSGIAIFGAFLIANSV